MAAALRLALLPLGRASQNLEQGAGVWLLLDSDPRVPCIIGEGGGPAFGGKLALQTQPRAALWGDEAVL